MAMKPGMRMMMLDKLRQPERQPRSEYGGDNGRRMIGYDRDAPRMPDRERSHPPMGMPDRERGYPPMGMPGHEQDYPPMGGMPDRDWRHPPTRMPGPVWGYPPMEMYGGMPYDGYDGGMEMRRRRDRRGRYMMGGMDVDDDDDDKYRLRGGKMVAGAVWSEDDDKHHGHWKVDERKAMEWTRKMRNPDGSAGPHFKPELAEQLRAAHCPKCDRWEFFVALNMMYADYCEVAKKFAADKPEFYVCMAKAFLEDPDAGEGKLAKYMEYIPE